ncbi:hypothetical protein J6G99_07090 [bacterium]|nr:hypothetical protein [bacterium]
MKENQIEKYCQFIRVIMERINSHFDDQKEYIKCREGCSLCCQNGEYPCSELEFEFLKIGFMSLEHNIQKIIVEKVEKLKQQQVLCNNGEKFIYECPFLIDNKCSVYKFRMIICRTFGLSYFTLADKQKGSNIIKVPFCCMQNGLNYSEVYDVEKNTFSNEKFKKGNFKKEPMAYNLSNDFLMEKFGKEIMDIDFGEIKPLIDWL